MNVITGLNEAQIDSLVRSKASFEINGLRGNFMAGIKLVEPKIEKRGMPDSGDSDGAGDRSRRQCWTSAANPEPRLRNPEGLRESAAPGYLQKIVLSPRRKHM